MNRLKTWNDGSYMPLWQKDLEFIQEALGAPIITLCETLLGKKSGIITGCKVSTLGFPGNITTSITEGLVLMDGEIVYCPKHSATAPAAITNLEKFDAYDSAGDKVFRVADSSEVRRAYYTPYAQLTSSFSIDGKRITLDDEGKKTLIECLFEKLYEMAVALPYEVIESSASSPTGASNHSIKYAKIGKQVFVLSLGGYIRVGDGSAEVQGSYPLAFTLPVGFRPAVETFFTYKVNQLNNNSMVRIGSITPAGQIFINGSVTVTASAFNFLT